MFPLLRYPYPNIASTSQIVILEDIRQKHIFIKYPEYYFEYLSKVQERCLEKFKRDKNMERCASSIASELGMNSAQIEDTVTEVAKQCSNSLFNSMIDDKYHYSYVN